MVWGKQNGQLHSERSLSLLARAFQLAPGGTWGEDYGQALIAAGHLEEARAVSARTHSVSLEVALAAATAHFDQELKVATRALWTAPPDNLSLIAAVQLIPPVLDSEQILGRAPGVIAPWLVRYLDTNPAQIIGGVFAKARVIRGCTERDSTRSQKCLATLRRFANRGTLHFSLPSLTEALDGAERYAQGDMAGAAMAWRPLAAAPDEVSEILLEPMVDAFERGGEPELAMKMDAWVLERPGRYNGADLSRVRTARRAWAAGDKAVATKWAREVVDAWAVADDRVPAVDEMRGIPAAAR